METKPVRVSSLAEFGNRRLVNKSELLTRNAWDKEPMDAEMLQQALIKIENQGNATEEEVERFDTTPKNFWNHFYSAHDNKFFKDRNWLAHEFPELFVTERKRLCEIGCGAGNTVFPFLEVRGVEEDVFAYAVDYSDKAIEVVKGNERYNTKNCQAVVYDLSADGIPDGIEEGSIDVVTLIFCLSALNPRDWKQAADNIYRMLKPGGLLLFRDYGRYDLAQLRFKPGRRLSENFYRRGDGTRVYFFTLEEMASIFSKFEIILNDSDNRLIVNRKRELKMFRCWQQGKYRKAL